MTEERVEIFREHFGECLEHFSKRFVSKFPQGKKNRQESMKPIADFCGLAPKTLQRVIDHNQIPVGEGLIKLTCFLDLQGYRIIEFERLGKVLRSLAELIGFAVLSPGEVTKLISYQQTSQIYTLLRGGFSLSKEKEAKIYDLWKSKREELESKKKDALKRYRIDLTRSSDLERTKLELVERKVRTLSETNDSIGVRRLATLDIMRGLRSLLDEGLFEGLSQDEVDSLGHSDVLCIAKLSAHFSALSLRLVCDHKE